MSAPDSARGEAIPIADDTTSGPTRREALQWMAASLALAGGGCVRSPEARIYPYVDMPEAGRAGALPAYYATAHVRDGFAHGVLVGTRDGRPIKVEGNPAHPSSRGGSDIRAQASILELWDPDRSQGVWQQLASSDANVAPGQAASSWPAFDAAWQSRSQTLQPTGGATLAILTASLSSPSQQRALAALLGRFPSARVYRHAPLAAQRRRRGLAAAFNQDVELVHHFDRARVIVSFAADPFSDSPAALRQAADWAAVRAGTGRGERERGAAAPLAIAIETTPGLFGARADVRVGLAPAAIEALIDEVDARVRGGPVASPLAERIAGALQEAGAAALVVAGETLSPRAHAQVAALLQRLGAFGRTVEAIAPPDAATGTLAARAAGSLAELSMHMADGSVDSLLILDANPAYTATGDVAFAQALAALPFSVCLGLYRDETSRLCRWHLPASHGYEQWDDALGHDGTATIVQPAIAPLYDTRSPIEWLAALADPAAGAAHDGHAFVRATWAERSGIAESDFEAWWVETLRRGVVADSAAAPLALPDAIVPARASETSAPPLVLVVGADAAIGDGAMANNGWLQELPRPLTRITWGNALLLGPRTAAAHDLSSGDVARVLVPDGAHVDAPVWVQNGHAEAAATLALGYGRRHAGRVGDGIGVDAYPLTNASGGPISIRLVKTGRRHAFAVTQHRIDQAGRDLAKSVVSGATLPAVAHAPSLYPERSFPEHAWAMAIDLDACIGCGACTIACQAENNIPVVGAEQAALGRAMHWIRVDHYEADDAAPEGHADSAFQPVPCMHCENAPCEVVCPVGATVHDSEGLNVQVYNRCVGTRFCSNNCPYKVRRFNFLAYDDSSTETLKAMRNPDVTVRRRGVMEKCTYCVQRISRARIEAEISGVPIADGAVVSACQAACPTRAIHFGDGNDPTSDVARAKASPRHYALLEELNTRPRTTYLARVRKEAKR